MKNNNSISRRKVLSTLGATAAATGMVGQAAAGGRSSEKIFEQALKIREMTGSTELFEQYLLNRGFEISQQNSETHDYTESNGDVSIKRAERPNLDLKASVYTSTYSETSYADADWNVYRDLSDAWNDWDDAPKEPEDVVGIGWEHTDYDIEWDTWNSTEYASYWDSSHNDIVWKFSDTDAYMNRADGDDHLYGGWASVEMDGTNPVDERSILVSYQHTWVGGEVTGFSFDSSGALSITVDFTAKKWDRPKRAHSEDAEY